MATEGNRLAGKVAVITGAGQGIGRGIARRFAREGAKIVVAELNTESGPRVVSELEELGTEAIFVPTDVCVEEQARGCVRAAIDRWGRIDILVNNAWGGGITTRLEWTPNEALEQGFTMGLMAAFWTMQEAFEPMKAQGGGSIINIASLNGVNSHVFTSGYNTGKEAMRTLTRNAAVEWGRWNIRSNVICPGAATEAYVAFSTANPDAFAASGLARIEMVANDDMSPLFDATILATEESVINALVASDTMTGAGGRRVLGLPHDRLRDVLRKYNRLVNPAS